MSNMSPTTPTKQQTGKVSPTRRDVVSAPVPTRVRKNSDPLSEDAEEAYSPISHLRGSSRGGGVWNLADVRTELAGMGDVFPKTSSDEDENDASSSSKEKPTIRRTATEGKIPQVNEFMSEATSSGLGGNGKRSLTAPTSSTALVASSPSKKRTSSWKLPLTTITTRRRKSSVTSSHTEASNTASELEPGSNSNRKIISILDQERMGLSEDKLRRALFLSSKLRALLLGHELFAKLASEQELGVISIPPQEQSYDPLYDTIRELVSSLGTKDSISAVGKSLEKKLKAVTKVLKKRNEDTEEVAKRKYSKSSDEYKQWGISYTTAKQSIEALTKRFEEIVKIISGLDVDTIKFAQAHYHLYYHRELPQWSYNEETGQVSYKRIEMNRFLKQPPISPTKGSDIESVEHHLSEAKQALQQLTGQDHVMWNYYIKVAENFFGQATGETVSKKEIPQAFAIYANAMKQASEVALTATQDQDIKLKIFTYLTEHFGKSYSYTVEMQRQSDTEAFMNSAFKDTKKIFSDILELRMRSTTNSTTTSRSNSLIPTTPITSFFPPIDTELEDSGDNGRGRLMIGSSSFYSSPSSSQIFSPQIGNAEERALSDVAEERSIDLQSSKNRYEGCSNGISPENFETLVKDIMKAVSNEFKGLLIELGKGNQKSAGNSSDVETISSLSENEGFIGVAFGDNEQKASVKKQDKKAKEAVIEFIKKIKQIDDIHDEDEVGSAIADRAISLGSSFDLNLEELEKYKDDVNILINKYNGALIQTAYTYEGK